MESDPKRRKLTDGARPSIMDAQTAMQRIEELERQLADRQLEINRLKAEKDELGKQVKDLSRNSGKKAQQSRYWRKDEHDRFMEALKKYGRNDVKAIAAHVGTRNPTQVRTHAQKYFLKLKREAERGGASAAAAAAAAASYGLGSDSGSDDGEDDLDDGDAASPTSGQQDSPTVKLNGSASISRDAAASTTPAEVQPSYPSVEHFLQSPEAQIVLSALRATEGELDASKRYDAIRSKFLPHRSMEQVVSMVQAIYSVYGAALIPPARSPVALAPTFTYPTIYTPEIKLEPSDQHGMPTSMIMPRFSGLPPAGFMMYQSGTGTTPTSAHWPAELPDGTTDSRLLSPVVESSTIMSLSDQMMKSGPQLPPTAPSNATTQASSTLPRPAAASDDYDQEDQELKHLTNKNASGALKPNPIPPAASPSGGLSSFLGQPITLSPMFAPGITPFSTGTTPLPGLGSTPLFHPAASPVGYRPVNSPLYFFNSDKPKS